MGSATGLMAFYAEYDDADTESFRRWHNCEHMAERVSIPGFLRGVRWRSIDLPRRFLMIYETDDAAVLASEAYQSALNSPTPWTRQALTWFRNPARAIYTLRKDVGSPGWRPAPYEATARFNLAADTAEDVCATWLQKAHDAGAVRARLYEVDEAISGMMTSERKIYGGGPGQQQYLVMMDFMEPFETYQGIPDADLMQAEGATDLYFDRLLIDYALEAPDASASPGQS